MFSWISFPAISHAPRKWLILYLVWMTMIFIFGATFNEQLQLKSSITSHKLYLLPLGGAYISRPKQCCQSGPTGRVYSWWFSCPEMKSEDSWYIQCLVRVSVFTPTADVHQLFRDRALSLHPSLSLKSLIDPNSPSTLLPRIHRRRSTMFISVRSVWHVGWR